jgi:hypothetical protein
MTGQKIFVQAEGLREIRVIEVVKQGTVRDVVSAAAAQGIATATAASSRVFAEDREDEIPLNATLEAAGVGDGDSLHIHRCKRIGVTVHFNGNEKSQSFAPGTTVNRVKEWAVSKKAFNLNDVDAAEHVLQIVGTRDRPDEDVHIGTLTTTPSCALDFDLVPKVRVEG